jgi:hypothetical protein
MDPATSIDVADAALRLLIDLVAMAALAALAYRRQRRRDPAVAYALFNVGLFLALVVITAGGVGLGVGFGLFAILSIIRLRSEPFTLPELGYCFVALVLALVTGVALGDLALTAGLAAIAVAAAAVIDHPRLVAPGRRLEVRLEALFESDEALRSHLEERLKASVTEVRVLELDYVGEVTRVDVRCV